MITLAVEEYCHDCPRFDAEVSTDNIIWDANQLLAVHHTITCKDKSRCAVIKEYLEKKENKNA